jgi:hypothetical protein
MATIADVKSYLEKKGPATGVQIAVALHRDGTELRGLPRMLADSPEIMKNCIVREPSSDSIPRRKKGSGEFERYPYIGKDRRIRFSPGPRCRVMCYTIHHLEGQEKDAGAAAEKLQTDLKEDGAKIHGIVRDFGFRIYERFSKRRMPALFIGGNNANCLGFLNISIFLQHEGEETANVAAKAPEIAKLLPSSDVDVWVFSRKGGIYKVCRELQPSLNRSTDAGTHSVNFELIPISAAFLDTQMQLAADGNWSDVPQPINDFLRARPLDGRAIKVKREIESDPRTAFIWKGLVEAALHAEQQGGKG